MLLFNANTWQQAKQHAESGLNTVKKWLDLNILTLNIKKTKYSCYSINKRGQPDSDFSLTIHRHQDATDCTCQPLDRATTIKYLGVQIDCNLNWIDYTDLLSRRTRKLIPIFRNVRNVLDSKTIKTVYFALGQTLITYGIVGWGSSTRKAMEPVNKAQKALLRTMANRPYRYPSNQLFTELRLLDVRQLYILTALTHFHKDMTKHQTRSHTYMTRQRQANTLLLPKQHTTFGQRHYLFHGPKRYNIVNNEMPGIETTKDKTYRRLVTNWLIECGRERANLMIDHVVK